MTEPGRARRILAGLDARTGIVYVYAAFAMFVMQYGAIVPVFLRGERPFPVGHLLPWSLMCFLVWFVGPALIVTLLFRERLADYGLTFRGMGRHLWIYVAMFLLMVPVILIVSRFPDFQRTYPFTPSARNGLHAFLTWELIYGLQFFALEFFFRGFLIFGPAKRLGPNSIFVMVLPYCMLHFYKPGLEAAASIFAGLILGMLAWRTRCVLGGVLIHWAVAATMDAMAILQTGGFR